ncbi:MAG: guanyl-specific ribonuclease Sa [Rhodospirillales bacterium]|nr:guanyl-specific ribonuclease Sa [Rhodospirillales bacterium]
MATRNGLVNVRSTIDRIKAGEKFPHRNDGSVFQDREGLLPKQSQGYYREYVHPTPGVNGPGAQRVIQGQNGELYYSPDHYRTFVPLN